MKTALITGANGYIGRHVTRTLLDQGVCVLAVHRGEAKPDPRAVSIRADFGDFHPSWYEATGTPDVCLHLAWSDGFNHNAESHIEMLPVHARFAAAVMQSGVKQFLGMGSMHEVGYWEGQIDEATANRPRSKYGIAKNALREIINLDAKAAGCVFQWVRAFYILGDDRFNKSLFAKILEWEREGREKFPFNSGRNKYDFIDVARLAELIAAVASQDQVVGVIDCCSGVPVPLRDRVEQFIEKNNLKIRPDYGAFPDREYDSPAIWGDPEKINTILSRQKVVA